jgi:toxin ParE1/3/4
MAFRIIWSKTALNDIKNVVRYISIDSPARAECFALKIISEIERLALSPHIGRAVPEYRCLQIRRQIGILRDCANLARSSWRARLT